MELRDEARAWCPRIGELWDQLPSEMQVKVQLAIPTSGDRPYFGIAEDNTVLQPADPLLKVIFQEMSNLLWEHARGHCRAMMDQAATFRRYLDNDPTLVDFFNPDAPVSDREWVDATAVEVLPEERRLS